MDWLYSVPAFIKVGSCFAGTLVLYRVGVSLGVSVLINAMLLTLFAGAGVSGIGRQMSTFLLPKNYLLPIVILLLLFFTEALNKTGRMDRTMEALKQWFRSNRMLFSGLPALVGLLPMPGGALFSAPLVASLDKEGALTAPHKVAINYWFRHIWEYWWPLYPGVFLAIQYSTLSVGTFFLIQIPLTIISVLGGYFFILRPIHDRRPQTSSEPLDKSAVVETLGPIGVLVLIAVVGSVLLAKFLRVDEDASVLSMLAGLAIALTMVFRGRWKMFPKACGMFTKKATWSLVLVVVGVQALSAALQLPLDISHRTLVALMRDEFLSIGIPIVLVMILVPFISGAVTGVALGFVGASFPLVFALLGHNPPTNVLLATTTLAYASGYIGMLLSPVHICFVVTNEYFETKLFSSYKYLWGPIGVLTVGAAMITSFYYFALRGF